MTIWGVLEIEPTDDLKVIKRAYAKKLKIHHPEDDPEGYQRLREAYDSALKQAKQILVQPPSFDHEHDDIVETDSGFPARVDLAIEFDSSPVLEHPIDTFMREVEKLYADFFARIEPENWRKLLNSDIVWDVEQNEALQNRLMYFLEDHRYLPHSVWKIIDTLFHWSEQKEELDLHYDEEFIEYVLQQINGSREMRYDYFKKVDGLDFDQFLELREEAQNALMMNDLDAAKDYLDEAYQLYPEDPDLLLMQGEYHLRTGDTNQALNLFNQLLHLHSDDLDARMHRARIQYNLGQFTEAIEDCEHILSLKPKNTDAMSLIGKCYIELGDIENAKQRFIEVLKLDLYHIEARIYVNQITNPTTSGIQPEKEKTQWIGTLIFFLLMFVRRSWIYILLYFAVELTTSFPFTITDFLLIPIIWESWKSYRTFVF